MRHPVHENAHRPRVADGARIMMNAELVTAGLGRIASKAGVTVARAENRCVARLRGGGIRLTSDTSLL